jgi:sugar/nucleoside kinase (ribokinase family)
MTPAILTAIGRDPEGQELLSACRRLGIVTEHVYLSEDLPTDRYMAVEGRNGLIAAIADAHSLEAADDKILRPLSDGTFGSAAAPYSGLIALDGNLTQALLTDISKSALFSRADLRIAPASPGKAERLVPLLTHPGATFYVNLEEAGLLAHERFSNAKDAAEVLRARGAARVLVTNGGDAAAHADKDGIISAVPPSVLVTRVTGAGDTFMAAHIAAQMGGAAAMPALESALQAAADYVSGDTTL